MTPAPNSARASADEIEAAFAPLAKDLHQAWWDASTEATDENTERQAAAGRKMGDFLGDPEVFAGLRAALDEVRVAGADAELERRLQLLHDEFVPNQVNKELRDAMVDVETSVEATFNRHRGHVGGREVSDNEILEVLEHSDDSEARRRHWEAGKEVGAEVAERVRELARLRNEAARSLGYRDHYALALETTDLDEERLFATLDAVDRATAEPFARWKAEVDARLAERFGCAVADLGPWHYSDPFFQHAPKLPEASLDGVFAEADIVDLTIQTYDGIGIDARQIIGRSDLFPREGKTQHAFATDIDREGDIRVLCNIAPVERWAETTLHEIGHGVYDQGIDPAMPWIFRTPAHSLTTEGAAMWFGRLVHDADWLEAVAGVRGKDLDALRGPVTEKRRAALLVFARWVLVMMHFERGLYRDPDDDHDRRWWELVERFQRVRVPGGRNAPDWAAKIHIAVAPVYYQNYMYGELFASHMDAALLEMTGARLADPAVGQWWNERVFGPGASLRWDHLIERATGRPFSVAAFEADIAMSVA
ncbi:MAG TPA: M2 family metallopeptidase [Acidimicrobiia bacterium]|nr:M2 family metallopeptidase [Acidimicrobiia bacterium]